MIPRNPFADLPSEVPPNPSRAYFVTREEIQRVLGVTSDAEWRLLIALARYGGLRVPSEPLRLTWGDIDLERGRMRVESPKTERHEGHAERVVPLFPELRPFLDEAWRQAHERAGFVITRHRLSAIRLRKQLLKDMEAAGVEPWPRLWQNMRASRETELVETFPGHVVTSWIGHSIAIAEKHYLQVTEDHFAKAVQNPVQSVHARPGTAEPPKTDFDPNPLLFRKMREHAR